MAVTLPDLKDSKSNFNDVKIVLTFEQKKDAACEALRGLSSIKSMCGKSGKSESIGTTCNIQVGGSGGIAW